MAASAKIDAVRLEALVVERLHIGMTKSRDEHDLAADRSRFGELHRLAGLAQREASGDLRGDGALVQQRQDAGEVGGQSPAELPGADVLAAPEVVEERPAAVWLKASEPEPGEQTDERQQ